MTIIDYSSFNYHCRSDDAKTPGDIHRKLLIDLGSYFDRDIYPENVKSWMIGMSKHRSVFPQRWSWINDISYLENKGYLGIGNYSVLKQIVSFSEPLERMIDRASEDMQSGGNGKSIHAMLIFTF